MSKLEIWTLFLLLHQRHLKKRNTFFIKTNKRWRYTYKFKIFLSRFNQTLWRSTQRWTSHFRFLPAAERSHSSERGGKGRGRDLWECNTRNPETELSAGYIQERVVRAGGRLRALGPHAAVPHSLRVLMRQVHLTPNPPRSIYPFPAVPSTTSFTWTLPTSLLPSPALPLSTLRLSGVANRSIAQVGHVCTRRRHSRHRRRRGWWRRRRQRMHFRARCYLSSRSRQRREWKCAIRAIWTFTSWME